MKPFQPDKLPLAEINWERLVEQIAEANATLARYDGLLQAIPDSKPLFSPLTTQEAVLSSKIEGTQASLEEVLSYQAKEDPKSPKATDIVEVMNYRKALQHGVERLSEDNFPLSLRLIREMHSILLDSVRGENKRRGDFRREQNWIGSPGSKMEDARYVPPAPTELNTALDNFEKYIHFEERDRLVQLAIIHAQFEIIHPFIDGNGRLGRLLVPLFLFEKRVLSTPLFYISAFFESQREQYYDKLLSVTDEGDWMGWISYFLKALTAQANKSINYANAIIKLYEKMKTEIVELTNSKYAIEILDYIFRNPIFPMTNFYQTTNIPRTVAKRILPRLEGEILEVTKEGSGSRPTWYAFKELLEITKK